MPFQEWLDRAHPVHWELRLAPRLRLWTVDLLHGIDDAMLVNGAAPLSTRELERVARFRFERDRRRYWVSHAVLNTLLAEHAGCHDPASISVNAYGKPFLPGCEWHFNMSHSGDLALIGLSPTGPIGVDIEKHLPMDHTDALADCNFTDTERAAWSAIPARERLGAFYRCWTRKEAMLKALGSGLVIEPRTFEAGIDENPARSRVPFEDTQWSLSVWTIPLDIDAAAAVSLATPSSDSTDAMLPRRAGIHRS